MQSLQKDIERAITKKKNNLPCWLRDDTSQKFSIARLTLITFIVLLIVTMIFVLFPVDYCLSAEASNNSLAIQVDEEEVTMLAKLIWGEARGVPSDEQKAAVVWCVLNRVDSELYPNTINEVVTQEYQFSGYSESNPVTEEFKEIAEDVLIRWHQEKDGIEKVGRVLPCEYLFFWGDGVRNYFSVEWRSQEYYDWSLPSPYSD